MKDEISRKIILTRFKRKNVYAVDWSTEKSNIFLVAKGAIVICWEFDTKG